LKSQTSATADHQLWLLLHSPEGHSGLLQFPPGI